MIPTRLNVMIRDGKIFSSRKFSRLDSVINFHHDEGQPLHTDVIDAGHMRFGI